MFQYAAARTISQRTRQDLLLDLSDFSNYSLHQGFELDRVFDLNVEVASRKDVQSLLEWQGGSLARKILRRSAFSWLRRTEFLVEPYFDYWPAIEGVAKDCYLMGYWQSEKYFGANPQTVRDDFKFRQDLSGENSRLAEEIRNTQSVSLHIRRGDYASDPKTRKVVSLCSLDYYRKAIEYVATRTDNPSFYVFSDDMKWVRENLPIRFPCTYVEHNRQEESYRDMQLMSLCRNNVIANSTFSWWGAWLNSRPDKVVVAPRRWFTRGSSGGDLIPASWVTV